MCSELNMQCTQGLAQIELSAIIPTLIFVKLREGLRTLID